MSVDVNLDKETALIEAILFLESEPQSEAVLVRNSELSKDVVDMALQQLKEKYSAADSGIELIQISGGWTLSPKRELWDFLKERYGKKSEGKLSRAAMETLSIIAYSQPITRAEIEKIRGVNSDHAINKLVEYGLIEEVGRLNAPGRPMLFGTTEDFLRNFGVTSIDELPSLSATEMADFEAEAEEEVQIRLGV